MRRNKKMKKTYKGFILLNAFILMFFLTGVSAITESVSVGDYLVEYEYSVSRAEAGEKFSLKVTITNEGDENKEDILFEFNEDDPFDLDRDDSFGIDLLEPEQSESETFRVEIDDDARDQDYDLEFTIEDSEDDYKDEVIIEVDSNRPDLIIGDIRSLPSTISPDLEDVQLILTIENIGGGDAEFVRIKLKLPKGFSSSSSFSDISNLGIIKEGGSKEVTFFIDTAENLEAGNHNGVLSLEYEDPNSNEETQELSFDLPVKGRPQFIISGSSTNPLPVPGGSKDVELRVTVQNIGDEEAEETSIRVFESSDQPFEFSEKTRHIGSLQAGESGTAVFSMEVDGDARANTYYLKVQTRTVNDGNVLVTEKTLPVKVVEGEGTNFIGIGVFGIVIIVILIFVVRIYRKRKKNK
jgi:hypothetical protein